MRLRSAGICVLLLFFSIRLLSQDYYGYGSSNYGGINQVFSNPAALADNRIKLDIVLGGVDLDFNNSWFSVKRNALKYSGSLFKPNTLQFPLSWQNITPNVSDNIFKNFNFINSSRGKAISLTNRIMMPSVMLQINGKNTLAFAWSVRQIMSIRGLSPQAAYLFEKEFDLNVTQNNNVKNRDLSAIQMTWAEYGLTYARVLKDKHAHFLKAGITPKILQGFESAYFVVNNLDFLFSTKDTSTYFNTKFSYAHSANLSSPFKGGNPVSQFYHYVTKPSVGLDFGFIYEWRPDFTKYKYRPDGKNYAWRKDLTKYKLKLGMALTDVGRIKFTKQGVYYDFDARMGSSYISKLTSLKKVAQVDSSFRKDFGDANARNQYFVYLPTAINVQADYAFTSYFYVNISAHLTNLNKNNLYRVSNYSSVCFAPRFEHYWFEISLPVSYNTLSVNRGEYLFTGVNLRMGPLSVGSNNLKPLFKGDVAALNFYILLKATIPYKKIRDRDGDDVPDKKDECPDEAGDYDLKGCPDKDKDKVPDKTDACPNQPGLIAFKGCPDTDGDGITDGEDACPKAKGSLFLKGCPDMDGDSIADKDDSCPDVKGLKKFKGCPDTDGDGIQDKDDMCPLDKGSARFNGCPDTDGDKLHDGIDNCKTIAGPVENKGCPWPDTDGDGVIDKLDSCINIAGLPEYKGCPEPMQINVAEKKIIEKAYTSLEFATGKDKIKAVSFPALNNLAYLLLSHKAEWKIILSGYTDNSGTEEGNMILSEKRAKAVKAYLIKRGLPEENIEVNWFGQSNNLADNDTEEGRQKNRRVEMKVLMKEVQ